MGADWDLPGEYAFLERCFFWKDAITYQFLEPYDNPKKLEAAYQKHRKELLEDSGIITTEAPEHPMSRLYWSRHGFYASARYVQFNG